MATVHIPDALTKFTNGCSSINIEEASAEKVFSSLAGKYPDLVGPVFNTDIKPQRFVAVFLDGDSISDIDTSTYTVSDRTNIEFVAALAGG
ncbi:MoaD/ThiS family protein [Marinimicrobium locisalis]|uniref:MoaD/ThiS family protein n=1 Tax=Marinimicrobium locisalis TaxID=546022 RepID=UPI003221EF21